MCWTAGPGLKASRAGVLDFGFGITASADIFDLDMLNTHKVGRNTFHLPTGIPSHLLPPLLTHRTGFFRFRKVMKALLYRQMFHILYIPPSSANMPRGFCNGRCRCHARRGGVGRSGFCQGILGRSPRYVKPPTTVNLTSAARGPAGGT